MEPVMATSLASNLNKKTTGSRGKNSSAQRKRRRIMESAEQLFASKGFHQTTIADISAHSGVHEASIFQYFKTKENLLVAIPERHLKKTLAGITEHLQGMKGAEPKLRKLIWHQLRDLSINRNYTSILLLDLRTMPAFYTSPAYEMIRKYSGFAQQAIREGMEEGTIDPDLEPILVLEMIFGAIDSIVLQSLFFDRPYDPEEVADELFQLVIAAVRPRKEPERAENGDELSRGEITKRAIVRAAAQVFGAKGYGGATISEIATRAGIAEASIYQYFKSKEELLLSVPGAWFNELAEELDRVFSGDLDPAERLVYLFRRWGVDFQTRRRVTRVLILELYRNRSFYSSQAYKNTHSFWRLVRSTVEEGRKTGVFRDDFKTDKYLHLVQGTFEHEALARMMLTKREMTVSKAEKMIEVLLRAIRA
jgi:TetR/AcrR family fatty acid metabolism transcriptional regulator